MTRKLVTMLVIGLFVGAFSGIALAEGPGYYGDMVPFGAEKSSMEAAASWPAAEPVETGAVPERDLVTGGKISPDSTHFNPFYPERRILDQGGGGE